MRHFHLEKQAVLECFAEDLAVAYWQVAAGLAVFAAEEVPRFLVVGDSVLLGRHFLELVSAREADQSEQVVDLFAQAADWSELAVDLFGLVADLVEFALAEAAVRSGQVHLLDLLVVHLNIL